jgi:hypothetical protein
MQNKNKAICTEMYYQIGFLVLSLQSNVMGCLRRWVLETLIEKICPKTTDHKKNPTDQRRPRTLAASKTEPKTKHKIKMI